MFGIVKKASFTWLKILSSCANVNSLSWISMNNQECETRPQVVNGDEPVFFPFSIKTSNGSCHNINHPYAEMCSWYFKKYKC